MRVLFCLVLMESTIQMQSKRWPLTLSKTMCSGVKRLYWQYQVESLELTATGILGEQEQGGMVVHVMMLTVRVDGKGESDNLIHTLIPAFHGLMQKWLHFFVKVAHACMFQKKAAASQMIGYSNMLCHELHLVFLRQWLWFLAMPCCG